MTLTGRPLATSNWGTAYQDSGILAPGQNILVATASGDVALRTGTSYATAIVSGIIGLLLSRELRLGRPPRPFLIRDALLSTALACNGAETDCRRFLGGRLNIAGAISYLDCWSTPMTDESQTHVANQSTVESESMFNSQVSPMDGETQSRVDDPRESIYARSLRWPSDVSSSGVEPSACSGCRSARPFVYAMGQLGYDFGTEAGLDAFRQRMLDVLGKNHGETNPLNEKQLIRFFRATRKEPWHHLGLSWTLNQNGSPIYVIEPEGPFADRAYQRLLKFFKEQYGREADRVAVPGVITGRKRLLNGLTVDVIDPDLRGLCNWNKQALIKALFCARGEQQDLLPDQEHELSSFLDRIYHELQNLGVRPEHRALNYAGTNLFEVGEILGTRGEKRTLDTIHLEPSQICRPGSDCWDVVLSFFNPDQLQPVSKIYRYTIDVSAVIPVTVGAIRSWEVRSR
jgi:cyanobactin maturation PatA/PatG family protease